MKQTEFSGFQSTKKIIEIIKKQKAKNLFFVTGKNSFKSSGAFDLLKEIFESSNFNISLFSEFSANPKIEEINLGLEKFEKQNYDLIIAIGGGSAIDTAKAIKLFYFNKIKKKIPLIATPTTAGTGSEATYFIAYYDNKKKISAGENNITLPEYSILDYSLLTSLPEKIKASSAMDALTQAIESYWSINSTEKSKSLSKKAIEILIKNIVPAIKQNDKQSNEKILLGANLSGKAINITKTTACHALSYPLTSFFNIPHGHAVSLTLAELLDFNYNVNADDCNDKRGIDYIKKTIKEIISFLEAKDLYSAKQKINNLMNQIGLQTKLSKMGINKEKLLDILNKNANPERMSNNPRKVNQEDIKEIIEKVY